MINNIKELNERLSDIQSDFLAEIPTCGGCINFSNTPRRGERKYFTLSLDAVRSALGDILREINSFNPDRYYKETAWRILGERHLKDKTCRTMIAVQTKPFYILLSKIVHVASGWPPGSFDDDSFGMEVEDLENAIRMLSELTS